MMIADPVGRQELSSAVPGALDLDAATRDVLRAVNGKRVDWKPAPADRPGGQWCGLDYIRQGSKVRREWEARWPTTVAIPAWDLVGRVQIGRSNCWEWVLVKVFRDPRELTAGSPPQQAKTLHRVERIFEEAKITSRAPSESDWASDGLDVATLIAIRAFLCSMGACGRMVFLCVGGDEWKTAIDQAKARFGIAEGTAVANRLRWVHTRGPGGTLSP